MNGAFNLDGNEILFYKYSNPIIPTTKMNLDDYKRKIQNRLGISE
jgi:hypothetical protein